MTKIGPYDAATDDWRTSTNGCWTTAKKGGRSYFIKKMLSPKIPRRDWLEEDAYDRVVNAARMWEKNTRRMHTTLQKVAKDCPSLVVPVDLIEENGSFYIISDWVRGALNPEMVTALSYDDKRAIAGKLLETLAVLDRNDVVHADIKPENVFVIRNSTGYDIRLFDFEEAYVSDAPPSSDMIGGSPETFSPETAHYIEGLGPAPTTRSDVFSAAVTLYRMFTGGYPQSAGGAAYMAVDDRDFEMDMCEDSILREVLSAMLRIDPRKRASPVEALRMLTEPGHTAMRMERLSNGRWRLVIDDGAKRQTTTGSYEFIANLARSHGVEVPDP